MKSESAIPTYVTNKRQEKWWALNDFAFVFALLNTLYLLVTSKLQSMGT